MDNREKMRYDNGLYHGGKLLLTYDSWNAHPSSKLTRNRRDILLNLSWYILKHNFFLSLQHKITHGPEQANFWKIEGPGDSQPFLENPELLDFQLQRM